MEKKTLYYLIPVIYFTLMMVLPDNIVAQGLDSALSKPKEILEDVKNVIFSDWVKIIFLIGAGISALGWFFIPSAKALMAKIAIGAIMYLAVQQFYDYFFK